MREQGFRPLDVAAYLEGITHLVYAKRKSFVSPSMCKHVEWPETLIMRVIGSV
jgi:hypothetical protein